MNSLPLPRIARRGVLLACTVAACGALAGPAFGATRYASVDGSQAPSASQCTDISAPCALATAIDSAAADDNLSLAPGTYDLNKKALPPFALHWVATNPQSRPVLTSADPQYTLFLAAGQSGTSFDNIEIDNTFPPGGMSTPAALLLGPGVTVTIASSVLSGPSCIVAPDTDQVDIADSTLTGTSSPCLDLGPKSSVRRSTVARATDVFASLVDAVLVTGGLVEDSTVQGKLRLTSPGAVARRVRASGAIAISGEGLVVDSLAVGGGSDGGAIAAVGVNGGTLRVIGSTAVDQDSPALLSVHSRSESATVPPNDLVVSNTIARSGVADVQGSLAEGCQAADACGPGLVHIDHSLFTTRVAPADGLIVEGPGNRGGDPLFADPTRGDYHLLARSPAIDAGVAQAEADPSDLDGHARAQGMAVDLGAFEATPSLSAGSGGPHGVITRRAVLSRLRVSPSRFHTGGRAKISFRLDNASSVRLSFQRVLHGHRKGRRCVSGGNGHGSRCTVLRSAGRLAVPHGQAGTNTVLFLGRLAGKALIPGSYRLTATPANGRATAVRITILG